LFTHAYNSKWKVFDDLLAFSCFVKICRRLVASFCIFRIFLKIGERYLAKSIGAGTLLVDFVTKLFSGKFYTASSLEAKMIITCFGVVDDPV
jgi:hypothetical protein